MKHTPEKQSLVGGSILHIPVFLNLVSSGIGRLPHILGGRHPGICGSIPIKGNLPGFTLSVGEE